MTNHEREAVRLWQKAISLIWQGRCGVCGKQGHAGHHIIPRRFKGAKFCLMNGIYLCADCHRMADNSRAWLLDQIKDKYPAIVEWHNEHVRKFNTEYEWYPDSWYKEQREMLAQTIEQLF